MQASEIVAEARSWIGTRWKHQGRDRNGIDCAGLVIKVGHGLGISTFDTTDYQRQATDESMLEACRQRLIQVPFADARPGDLPVMRFGTNRHICFFGDYLYGGLSLIHAYSRSPRRVIEHRFDEGWLRSHDASLMAVFRIPGVTE